jgi:hypothetical protein
MDPNPQQTYPSKHQPALDEHQMAFIENLFRDRITEIEQTHQQHYENQQTIWQAQLEENRSREQELVKQVEELQMKLAQMKLNPVIEPK